MAQKYNNYNEVMRELYRTSYIESPKVFIATDYGYDDYAYMQQKLDELCTWAGDRELITEMLQLCS